MVSGPYPSVGSKIHGFANGYFGRDSYDCRTIEAEGPDWLVTRNTRGQVELISRTSAERIDNINDGSHCTCEDAERDEEDSW